MRIALTASALNGVLGGARTLADAVTDGDIVVEPDMEPLQAFLSMLETFDIWFNIIEP